MTTKHLNSQVLGNLESHLSVSARVDIIHLTQSHLSIFCDIPHEPPKIHVVTPSRVGRTTSLQLSETSAPSRDSNTTAVPSNSSTAGYNLDNYSQVIHLVMSIVIFILGTFGNGLVIYVTGCKMEKTVNSVWFLNLALADFFFTFMLIFNIISTSRNFIWPFGDFMCKFYSLIGIVNMYASVFLLTAISLDRCLSTWAVVWAHNNRTLAKAWATCGLIWVASVLCSVPFITIRKLIPAGNSSHYCGKVGVAVDFHKSLVLTRFVLGFLIPFLVISCSYIAIGVRVKRLHRKKKYKSLRVILSVILAFFFCWLPFHILELMEVQNIKWNQDTKNILTILVHSLAFFNSCLNPILYVFMCEEFQIKLKQSLLVVLESAFTEENMAFFSTHLATNCRHSSQSNKERKDILTSLVLPSKKEMFTA
ncbi:C3a anaphylatoxin chemotactic receptor-like [Chanos chanos]|uniref:C3a anaphylatoxin chemotactic receptor-like n=1 Tax=Chanos chanos TaxID=29144 RepID=A0A6J2WB94_CHACN|nr:C3a anaphylatoxin chemotactic receptor-like [Chanos chanos]